MPSSRPAISEQLIEWLVLRSKPTNPWLFAYVAMLSPVFTAAPSELLMRGSASRPFASAVSAIDIARSASMSHGCH